MEEKIVEKSLYKAYTELKRFIAHEYSPTKYGFIICYPLETSLVILLQVCMAR